MSHKREAILEAFVQLLDEKPAKRITVNDIAARCGIGRNTFYYYFPNIPALFDALEEQWVSMMQCSAEPKSVIDCVAPIVDYAGRHKSGLLYLYRSTNRERFQSDLDRLWMDMAKRYVSQNTRRAMSDEERTLLTRHLKCVFVGVTLDWLDTGMEYDLVASVRRACGLLTGKSCGIDEYLKKE